MIELPENIRQTLQLLRKSSITGVALKLTIPWLRFDFTLGTSADYAIELYHVAHFSFNKEFSYNDDYIVVYDLTLNQLQDGGAEVLESLGYGLKNSDGGLIVNQSGPAYHLHIEGDVCFDVVCGNYRIFKGISAEDK